MQQQSDTVNKKRAEDAKKFLEWHYKLSDSEKKKFSRTVKKKLNIKNEALSRKIAKVQYAREKGTNPNYKSQAKGSKFAGAGVARAIGDALSPNNPKNLAGSLNRSKDINDRSAAIKRRMEKRQSGKIDLYPGRKKPIKRKIQKLQSIQDKKGNTITLPYKQ